MVKDDGNWHGRVRHTLVALLTLKLKIKDNAAEWRWRKWKKIVKMKEDNGIKDDEDEKMYEDDVKGWSLWKIMMKMK